MPYADVQNLALRRGIYFPTAEIYADAPAGFYEYGAEGTRIKQRMISYWRKLMVENENHHEIDGSIILPEAVFRASGHLENFADPLISCTKCHTPYRADKLIEEATKEEIPEGASMEYFDSKIAELKLVCTKCKSHLGKTQRFNMMMKTFVGTQGNVPGYLKPESCQNIFLNFSRIWKSGRVTLPFGIAQVGKTFRNEIAPRQALLRARELEQMDVEVFFNPAKINEVDRWEEVKDYALQLYLLKDKQIHSISCAEAVEQGIVSGKLIAYYLARTQQFAEKLNIPLEGMRFRELEAEARAFYAKETWDFEVLLDDSWLELAACNYRSDHDLKTHASVSKTDLQVKEEGSADKFYPHIFEISMGVGRTFTAMLNSTLKKETRGTEERWNLDLPVPVAPYHVGVFPLMKKDGLYEKAFEIFQQLQAANISTLFDEKGSIGKRYARIDEIGVPYAITVDYETLDANHENYNTITLRDRNSMQQKRVALEDLEEVFWNFSTGKRSFDDLEE
jgi:glycyl-tRNA synthetase